MPPTDGVLVFAEGTSLYPVPEISFVTLKGRPEHEGLFDLGPTLGLREMAYLKQKSNGTITNSGVRQITDEVQTLRDYSLERGD
jgi:hypothetical protein